MVNLFVCYKLFKKQKEVGVGDTVVYSDGFTETDVEKTRDAILKENHSRAKRNMGVAMADDVLITFIVKLDN